MYSFDRCIRFMFSYSAVDLTLLKKRTDKYDLFVTVYVIYYNAVHTVYIPFKVNNSVGHPIELRMGSVDKESR